MKMTEKEKIEKMMKNLDITFEEAQELIQEDKDIDKGVKKSYDLDKEHLKFAKEQVKAGHTTYKFTKRERKPNYEKRDIIQDLFNFLNENSPYLVEITNKERQIALKENGETKFELTLVQKRVKKE